MTCYYEEEEPELPVPMPDNVITDCYGSGKGSRNGGKGNKGGQGKAQANEELPSPAMIAVPPEASFAKLIFIINGHLLKETASVSKVVHVMCGTKRGCPLVPMLHLVTDVRQILLESKEQLNEIAAKLSESGQAANNIEIPGQPNIPNGAVLLADKASVVP